MTISEKHSLLLQLKIDYLSFIKQVLDWHDSNIMLVIFALLMEQDYLTQKQLEDLTGLKQSTISETIKKLIYTPLDLPVIETRKKGDSKKYYFVPLDFEQYIIKLFSGALKAMDTNLGFLPPLLYRLDALTDENLKLEHLKKFLHSYWEFNNMIRDIFHHSDEIIATYFHDKDTKQDFSKYITENDYRSHVSKENSIIPEDDSIEQIKKDFINEILEMQPSVGSRRELAVIFFALYLSHIPITQDELIKFTGYSRTTVSEVLSQLSMQKFLNVVKKPRTRKKYYEPKLSIKDFMSSRLKLSQYKIKQLHTTIGSKFIPDLKNLKLDDKNEETRLKNFFRENIRCIQSLITFSMDAVSFLSKKTSF